MKGRSNIPSTDKVFYVMANYFKLFARSIICILPVASLSVRWNIPKFFELQTCYLNEKFGGNKIKFHRNENWTNLQNLEYQKIWQVCATSLRDNYNYCRDYVLIANFLVMALIPFLLLGILNSLTFQVIRMSTQNNPRTSKLQQRDQGIAKMFVLIVSVFFFCNTPRIVLNNSLGDTKNIFLVSVCLLKDLILEFPHYFFIHECAKNIISGFPDSDEKENFHGVAKVVRFRIPVFEFWIEISYNM